MPSVITLQEAKLHLRVTTDTEDTLIQSLIGAAQEYIVNYLNQPIPGIASTPSLVPKGIKAAALLMVAEMYEHREIQVTGTIIEENPTFNRLLHFYRINIGI